MSIDRVSRHHRNSDRGTSNEPGEPLPLPGANLERSNRICQTGCDEGRREVREQLTERSLSRSGRMLDSPNFGFAEDLTPMSLSNADVAKVALLARLRVSPDELEMFTGQLNSIVDYVAQLQELDTYGVEPLAHGIEIRNVFREDVRGEPLPREQALANAPKRNPMSFLVPAVLD